MLRASWEPVCSASTRRCQRRQLPSLLEARLSREDSDPPGTQKYPAPQPVRPHCSLPLLSLVTTTVTCHCRHFSRQPLHPVVYSWPQIQHPISPPLSPSLSSLSLPPPSLPPVRLSVSLSLQLTDRSGNRAFSLMLKFPKKAQCTRGIPSSPSCSSPSLGLCLPDPCPPAAPLPEVPDEEEAA